MRHEPILVPHSCDLVAAPTSHKRPVALHYEIWIEVDDMCAPRVSGRHIEHEVGLVVGEMIGRLYLRKPQLDPSMEDISVERLGKPRTVEVADPAPHSTFVPTVAKRMEQGRDTFFVVSYVKYRRH